MHLENINVMKRFLVILCYIHRLVSGLLIIREAFAKSWWEQIEQRPIKHSAELREHCGTGRGRTEGDSGVEDTGEPGP